MPVNLKKIFLSLLLAITFILYGCENYAERTHKSWVPPPSAPVYDDSSIYARISAAIQTDPVLQGTQIEIKVKDGHVTLNGTVKNDDQLTRVNMHAWIVDGVKNVDNQIAKN